MESEAQQPSRAERIAEAMTFAGIRQASFARSSGTLISVVEAEAQGFDPEDGGRWMTICEDHGSNVQHDTLAAARSWASCPEGWCEECQPLAAARAGAVA